MTGERRDGMCPQDELAVGWAMHALEPDEEARLRDHLSGCVRCQRTVRSTHEVMAAMGGSVRHEEPPPRLRMRLMEAIEHIPQEPVAPSRPRHAKAEPIPLRPRRPLRRVLLTAAAAILVVAIGGGVGIRMNQLSTEANTAQARSSQLERAVELLTDPNTTQAPLRNDSGTEIATVVSGLNDAVVLPKRLNANDSGNIYVVWGTSGTSPVPLATFDVPSGSTGPLALNWSPDAHKHSGFAVSLEPGRTAPASPSTVLASGQVT